MASVSAQQAVSNRIISICQTTQTELNKDRAALQQVEPGRRRGATSFRTLRRRRIISRTLRRPRWRPRPTALRRSGSTRSGRRHLTIRARRRVPLMLLDLRSPRTSSRNRRRGRSFVVEVLDLGRFLRDPNKRKN